jgi:hypothetical protein
MVRVPQNVHVAHPVNKTLPVNTMPAYSRNLPKLSSKPPTSNLTVTQKNESARAAAAALVASFRSMRK